MFKTCSSIEKMDPEARDKCFLIMQNLLMHPATVPFRDPVDTTKIKKYKEVIKKPIDLKTVYNNLQNGNSKRGCVRR